MSKGIRTTATIVGLLTGAGLMIGSAPVVAAGIQVKMVEGSPSDYHTWQFQPVEITVPAGTTVLWHNSGQLDHTATAEDKSFDSGNVKPGGDFQFTFSTPGDFKYYCTPHKDLGMIGVVHVQGASTPGTAPTATTATTATTRTAAAASTSTTATTKPGEASSTTATTSAPAAGASTTTTTATGTALTTTTVAAATASGAPAAEASTTTTGPAAGESAAGGRHGSHGGKTNVPLVTLAGVLTAALVALTMRLLAAKS
jgi:plastocyanin